MLPAERDIARCPTRREDVSELFSKGFEGASGLVSTTWSSTVSKMHHASVVAQRLDELGSDAAPLLRRGIVGVIGGDQDTADPEAFEVGQAIVRAGMILCTGGRPFPGRAVKDVSMRGAATVAHARVIGFLPDHVMAPDAAHDSHLFVETKLPSTGRNAFTGLTPDAMIVFKGSRGTLTEMAFAWARGTPVWLWDSRGFLREKRQRHAVNRDGRGSVRDQMMDALAILPTIEADSYSVEVLDAALDDALDQAPSAGRSPLDVVRRIVERTGLTTQDQTGYPGRRDRPSSKDWFERAVVRISGSSHEE